MGENRENEGKPQIIRFSPEAREKLTDDGWRIFELAGKSIASYRKEGNNIVFGGFDVGELSDDSRRLIEEMHSRLSEVALPPSYYLNDAGKEEGDPKMDNLPEDIRLGWGFSFVNIRGSAIQPPQVQLELLSKYSEAVSRYSPKLKAVLGNAADYVDLAVQYYKQTGNFLFSYRAYKNSATITNTKLGSDYVAVGDFPEGEEIFIGSWQDDEQSSADFMGVVPLIVPVS